jgi:tetratricopeptide (TPR) repeat protein
MMTDYDAVKQTIDIYSRVDLLDEIVDMLELFHKHKIVPDGMLGYDLYSYGYNKAKKFYKAIEFGELALEASKAIEEKLAISMNLGKIYLAANKPIKAVKSFEFVINHSGMTPDLQLDYSAALFACNKKEKSYEILKELEKDLWKYEGRMADSILFNMGVHYIAHGDFKSGISHLAIGRNLNVFGSYSKITDGLPMWDGKPRPGKHLLFVSEGGIGDEIINIRFVKNIEKMGMTCSLLSTHGVQDIYDHLPFVKKINTETYKKKDYDYWTPMMSLAYTLDLDSDDLWTGPYLQAKPEFIEKHKNTIQGDFKVGLRWAGNPRYDHELHRSVNLMSVLNSMPKDNNWSLYSIQRDVGMEQLKQNPRVKDLSSELTSFDDLLGVIYNLDLVITSCTSVAHAACAMGKRTIILIPIMEYHTWAEGKPSSTWYSDNLRLIRQVTPETWREAYDELKDVLKDMK